MAHSMVRVSGFGMSIGAVLSIASHAFAIAGGQHGIAVPFSPGPVCTSRATLHDAETVWRGKVLGFDGSARADARVFVVLHAEGRHTVVAETRASANGSFELTYAEQSLVGYDDHYSVLVKTDANESAVVGDADRFDLGPVDVGPVYVLPAREVPLRVLDSDGRAVAGAGVYSNAWSAHVDSNGFSSVDDTVVTDEHGRCWARYHTPGVQSLSVDGDGYAAISYALETNAIELSKEQTIVLQAETTLRGVVRADDGVVVEGARVRVERARLSTLVTTTNSMGEFAVGDVCVGQEVTVTVLLPGDQPVQKQVLVDDELLEFALEPSRVMFVSVPKDHEIEVVDINTRMPKPAPFDFEQGGCGNGGHGSIAFVPTSPHVEKLLPELWMITVPRKQVVGVAPFVWFLQDSIPEWLVVRAMCDGMSTGGSTEVRCFTRDDPIQTARIESVKVADYGAA